MRFLLFVPNVFSSFKKYRKKERKKEVRGREEEVRWGGGRGKEGRKEKISTLPKFFFSQ